MTDAYATMPFGDRKYVIFTYDVASTPRKDGKWTRRATVTGTQKALAVIANWEKRGYDRNVSIFIERVD